MLQQSTATAISTSELLCRLNCAAETEQKLNARAIITTLSQVVGLLGLCELLHVAIT